MVLGGSKVPGLPGNMKVPDACLAGARKCRAMALDILGPDAESMSLSDMGKTMCKHSKRHAIDPATDGNCHWGPFSEILLKRQSCFH